MIVMMGTIVQGILTDKIVEQGTIAQVQVEHNVKQDTHVQEALDQIVVSLYCILF
jgi:mannose/fructose/N-acetylgalactosamine-specific phosphotransferase system component IID